MSSIPCQVRATQPQKRWLRPGKPKFWWFTFLFWLLVTTPANAAVFLRVAIETGAKQVQIGTSTAATVEDSRGNTLGEIEGMTSLAAIKDRSGISLQRWRSGQLRIDPQANGYVYIGDRWYRGEAILVPTGNGVTAINYVELEDYLASVVGGEVPTNWPVEALKAQAVAARSYALYKRRHQSNALYDLEDTTASQVYKGLESETNTTRHAVTATEGQVLTYNHRIIEAVFHSSSGGHTENVEDVWSSPRPYLVGVQDFDRGAPVFQWTEVLSQSDINRKISGIGQILSMTPEATTPQGRVSTMRIEGSQGSKVVDGDELRRILDLRSSLFTVVPQYGSSKSAGSVPVAFQINGRGFGHGVGLSQWGSYFLALQGYNYRQILGHYYRNTTLARIQPR
ncbi:SpoIID/LytB domain-containing protein [Geitlerinema sp. PCC 9228]|jgi:stage II sporulation protein D|uniref:SpoIID/LytB domain-containing protein n=1 Tax=Geitlerinema sp. PCC 9228 TaxID=111611 RepID=UPI0008F9A12C|nr:SpoIID/LytB domain-containing protein [Geitlerinema sp. PCC 9228]